MFKEYYRLTKPGIVYGNLLTTIAAYLFASRWHIVAPIFFATIVGISFVIASACVFNNYIDRDIDKKMERTKGRALVSGVISDRHAVVFAVVLAALGYMLLLAFVNIVATLVALAGFLVYVFAYTYSKRTTVWATEIGSIAGAAPIVVGYAAVTDRLDWTALILFLILVFWQMPHFYAIAMRRSDEYAAAGIPVLPLEKGAYRTKLQMLLYIFLFALAVFALTKYGYAGYWYLLITELSAFAWFWVATDGLKTQNDTKWARRSFLFSLFVLVVFSVFLSLAALLP